MLRVEWCPSWNGWDSRRTSSGAAAIPDVVGLVADGAPRVLRAVERMSELCIPANGARLERQEWRRVAPLLVGDHVGTTHRTRSRALFAKAVVIPRELVPFGREIPLIVATGGQGGAGSNPIVPTVQRA
jgi:hypothetical protein